jgi:hypothetical protein
MSNDEANSETLPPPPERWCVVLVSAPGSEVPIGRRVAGFLKSALRAWKLRCLEVSNRTPTEQLAAAREENARLHRLVEAQAERIAGQAEALARRAERGPSRSRKPG